MRVEKMPRWMRMYFGLSNSPLNVGNGVFVARSAAKKALKSLR